MELGERVAAVEATLTGVASKLEEIHKDVKSLRESRAYARGAWKATVAAASAVATVISFLVTQLVSYLRHP